MKDLFHLAADLQAFFIQHHWEFCFIGGIALQRWGEPRLTRDVDVNLLTGFGKEEPFVDKLLAQYKGRMADAKEFALTQRVLLLRSDSGIGIDIVLTGLPFEKTLVKRSTTFEFIENATLLTCSAEDLVVMKAFADRGRDWWDIETIIVRQRGHLDWSYILKQLVPLCEIKESPEIIAKLENLRHQHKE